MPSTRKILGQLIAGSLPILGANHILYTVPTTNVDTVVSNLIVCNQTTASVFFAVAVVPKGVTIAILHYTHYGRTLLANDTQAVLKGVTLAPGDSVQVAASIALVSFSLFGQENFT